KDYLVQFGGHRAAAGLTMLPEQVEHFKIAFEKEVSTTILPEQLFPEIEIDAEINFSDITDKFHKLINEFAPFGPENMRPVFVTQGVKDTGWSKIVKEAHIKFHIKQNGVTMNGI